MLKLTELPKIKINSKKVKHEQSDITIMSYDKNVHKVSIPTDLTPEDVDKVLVIFTFRLNQNVIQTSGALINNNIEFVFPDKLRGAKGEFYIEIDINLTDNRQITFARYRANVVKSDIDSVDLDDAPEFYFELFDDFVQKVADKSEAAAAEIDAHKQAVSDKADTAITVITDTTDSVTSAKQSALTSITQATSDVTDASTQFSTDLADKQSIIDAQVTQAQDSLQEVSDTLTAVNDKVATVNDTADSFMANVADKSQLVDDKYQQFDDNVTAANQTIDDILALQPQFRSVLDETTGKDVISAPEIILARNGEADLKARLDKEHQEVNAQLAQKATKTEVDMKLSEIVSGAPKGTYATLTALRTALPVGSTGVYVVSDDGKWYFWNGTAWTPGGIYQSVGIADKSITPEKTTFINNKLPFTLERGTIHAGVNVNTDLTTRVRSASIVKHTDGIYIVRKDVNYLIGVTTYENGIFDGLNRGWIDKDVIELPGKNELRINIRRRDKGVIEDAELATIVAGIEIKHNFQSANASDVERAVQDITTVKGSITQTILLKSEEFEIGTITGNTPVFHTTRARMKNMLHVYKGDIIKFQKDPTLVNYGISISDLNGVWRGVDYGWLNQPEFIIEEDSLIKLNTRYVDNRILDENTLKTLTENTFTIVRSIKNYVDNKLNTSNLPPEVMNTINKNTAIDSILVEYGRMNGASYVFARIPKTMNDGSRLVPKVALTSRDGSLSGAKRSTLNYARDQDSIFAVNAGLFNVSTAEPVGQLIIDGVSLINTPMTSDNRVPIHPDECYPLAIDGNGNLTTYPRNADTADMIADGVEYAVTAWGKLVDNFQISTADINNEIVHNGKRYIRQAIGQYQNGDYCVCSVDMTRGPVTNEAGLYYEELAQLFVDKGVKFAYSLDGGGSTQTVLGKRQLNPIYERADGRRVPTVIEFYIA